ncbi:BTB POZ fold [Lecanosticta acicola]|uniref:BTB POZ fold n=1 Tax=Lecanosticta acicola TaxID=111012 RepID=A0AAI8Z9M0_9PEZI|nr:BTB POZ fold [Lecanosticta acicola]
MTITCEGHVFQVSRSIVCPQSDVLEREIDGEYEEGKGDIKHDEYDAQAVNRMIHFLYDGDYDQASTAATTCEEEFNENIDDGEQTISSLSSSVTDGRLLAHINVHGIAGYYNIPKLRRLAAEKFQAALKELDWSTIDNAKIVGAIYRQAKAEDAGLRDAIVEKAMPHIDFFEDDEFPGEFLVRVLHLLSNAHKADQANMNKVMEELRSEVDSNRAGREMLQRSQDNIIRVERLCRDTYNCRHCSEALNVLVEGSGDGKSFIRCKSCRTKHGP